MCAILGFAGRLKRGQWPLVHRLLTDLFVASAVRGTDAAGFAALDSSGRLVTDKAPVASTLFAATSREWNRLRSPSCVIMHCRAATHGSPRDNKNNHPFLSGDKQHAVVVNGVSNNFLDVADAYSLRLTSDCDSEVIMRLVEASEHPAAGLDDALRDLQGGTAVASLDVEREVIWLARNESRPVWVFKLASVNGTFFCSTREIAFNGLNRSFGRSAQSLFELLIPLSPRTVVGTSADGHLIAAIQQENRSDNHQLKIAGTRSPRR
jgi:glucosamine 6-phosphate synthetase-like amidotransferase/phosphosugar isomerase protein